MFVFTAEFVSSKHRKSVHKSEFPQLVYTVLFRNPHFYAKLATRNESGLVFIAQSERECCSERAIAVTSLSGYFRDLWRSVRLSAIGVKSFQTSAVSSRPVLARVSESESESFRLSVVRCITEAKGLFRMSFCYVGDGTVSFLQSKETGRTGLLLPGPTSIGYSFVVN